VPMPVRFDAECWTDPYRRWIATYDYCPKRDRARLEAQLAVLRKPPLISVLMPVFNPPPDLLGKSSHRSPRKSTRIGSFALPMIAPPCPTSANCSAAGPRVILASSSYSAT